MHCLEYVLLMCCIVQTEVIVASSEVDVATSNQVDCTIDMLIAAASQQSTVSMTMYIQGVHVFLYFHVHMCYVISYMI